MRFLIHTAAALAAVFTLASGPVSAAVSISVAEPNFFGRIDIGGYPPPRLIYEQPIIVRPVKVWSPPIYVRVPPVQARQWDRYCNQYGACGRPVYFVDDAWYRDVYVPRYREYRPGPRGYHVPPPPPAYYEYRRDYRKPGKRIYTDQEYYQDRHKNHKGRH